MSSTTFSLKLTADFFDEKNEPRFADFGQQVLDDSPDVVVSRFADHRPVIESDQVADAAGVIVLTPQVTTETVRNADDLLAIGRFGVGFDTVDVQACTDQNVLVMITTGAVDRSMAEATIGWMIALTHRIRIKDQLVRTGDWDARTLYNGCELRDRTLGVIGLGGIGQELVRMLSSFGMRPPIACDPFIPESLLTELGVQSVSLEEVLRTADFVSIHCPLNDSTRGLIGARELSWMKSDAWLLNTARGGIVDEEALFETLSERRIAGAAIDCFEEEPVRTPHRFGTLDNVLLAPHSIGWTDELFRDIGTTAFQSMKDLFEGRRPHGVVNAELFDRPEFLGKWQRVSGVAPSI